MRMRNGEHRAQDMSLTPLRVYVRNLTDSLKLFATVNALNPSIGNASIFQKISNSLKK